ncbi:Nuclear receptor domain-containing protein [Aphelenchoides besseyi]|nr:Nuclear receptor domain-containing protein [Aphelenchoides besseyi]
MKLQKSTGDCAVCGAETRSLGFRVFVCKACAMFYRRSFRSRLELRCTGNGNCETTGGQRSNCRYCRMAKCREVGLRMHHQSLVVQHLGYPADDVFEDEASSSTDSTPPLENFFAIEHIHRASSLANPPMCPFIDASAFNSHTFPLLHTVAEILHRFESRQRSLVNSFLHEYEKTEPFFTQSIDLDNLRYLRIETGSLHLLTLLMSDILKKACGHVPTITSSSVVHLSLLHKMTLAVRQFPNIGDPRIALFLGTHADTRDLPRHLGDKFQERKNFVGPIWKVWNSCADRFKLIGPSAIESVILIVAFILENADRLESLNANGDRWRNAIYAEIYSFLARLHGSSAPSRLVRILALQLDAKELHIAYEEMWEMVKVFLPNFPDYYHHTFPANSNIISKFQEFELEMSRK